MVKGERLELVVNPETGRVDINLNLPSQPGQYTGPVHGYTGERNSVFFTLPVDESHPDFGLRHVADGPDGHSFTEESDGSLTVSPSILAVRAEGAPADPPPWHGYLERGEWRTC